MRVLSIARASGRRFLRDRTAVFFVLILPIILIVIVGAVARGFNTFRVGVVDLDRTPAAAALQADLAHASGIAVLPYASLSALDKAVARSEVNAGVVIPRRFGADERAGVPVTVPVLAEQANTTQEAASTRVTAVIQSYGGRVQAAQFATRYGGTLAVNLDRAAAIQRTTSQSGLRSETVSTAQATLPPGYEYSAPTELVLFVFLSAVTGGATVVETRRLGMFERMSAAPVRASSVIVGESLTYLAIALGQSALIVGIGSLAFGVSWGNPMGALLLVVEWCCVGAGAGMVAGTVFRTPEQASAIGPVVGITFAMLGGCMWPLSIVSTGMREFGHITPQAWAVDAWTGLLSSHGDVATIGRELGVLALFALGFFLLAITRFRTMLASGRV